jgi:hypothetical protein
MFSAPTNAEEALAEFRRQRATGPAACAREGAVGAQVDTLMSAMHARVAELEALRVRGGLQSQQARDETLRAAPAPSLDRGVGSAAAARSTGLDDGARLRPSSRTAASRAEPPGAPLSLARAEPSLSATASSAVPLRFRGVCDVPTAMDMLRGLSALALDAAAAAGCASPPAGVHVLGRGGAAAQPRAGLATVPVTFFADGFMLYAGPPRRYGSEEARRFLDAVLLGLLPFELKARHADGRVRFEIRDQRAHTLDERARARPAGARGAATVGGVDGPLDGARFVARLPATVVTAGGRLIPIRAEVLKVLAPHQQQQLQPQPRWAALAEPAAGKADAARGASAQPQAAARVRLQLMLPAGSAQPSLVLALAPDEPLCALRAEVARLVPAVRAGGRYALRRAFPAATFDGASGAALAVLDLSPSATLHVQLFES